MTIEDEDFSRKWNIKLPPHVPLKKEEMELMKLLGIKIIRQMEGVDWHISIHALLSVLETVCGCVNEEINRRKKGKD